MAVSISLSIRQNSQSIENNRSNVTVETVIGWTYGSYNATGQCYGSITIDGTTYNFTGLTFNASHTQSGSEVVMTKTVNVNHNDDGTKTLSCSASFETGISAGTVTTSKSVALTTIPLPSQPSLVTWPESTANVGNFGATFSIHMNRKSASFTHTVRYEYGDRTGTIATGVGTGTTWAVPLSFMNDIPNATSGSGRIYVDTYNGSALVGTRYTGFTATVPVTVKPTCTMTLEDITGTDDIYGSPVQGISQIKVTIKPTLAYSSQITTYSITANGVSYNTQTATTGVLQASGSSPVNVTVTDQRGRSGSASYTMSVQAYAAPAVTALTVHRCDEDGTENDQGEFVRVVFSAAITSLSSKNSAAYKLRYKDTNVSSWTEVTLTELAGDYTVSDYSYIFAADSNSSYDVEVSATDNFSTATRATSASTAFTLMNWGQDGTSMGIGKVAEAANTLQIALETEFIGKVKGSIFDAVWPVGSIYLAYNHTNPATLFGGSWTRITNAFLWATTAGGTIGLTGGEREVTLTVDQIPAHDHGGTYTNAGTARTHAWLASGGSSMGYDTVETGGGAAHNNMPPYIQVSVWRRTA